MRPGLEDLLVGVTPDPMIDSKREKIFQLRLGGEDYSVGARGEFKYTN